jgi:MID domain of medPIWI
MIDAFLYGQQTASSDADDTNASRLASIGLLQCYLTMLKSIPEHLHSCIQLQVGAVQI